MSWYSRSLVAGLTQPSFANTEFPFPTLTGMVGSLISFGTGQLLSLAGAVEEFSVTMSIDACQYTKYDHRVWPDRVSICLTDLGHWLTSTARMLISKHALLQCFSLSGDCVELAMSGRQAVFQTNTRQVADLAIMHISLFSNSMQASAPHWPFEPPNSMTFRGEPLASSTGTMQPPSWRTIPCICHEEVLASLDHSPLSSLHEGSTPSQILRHQSFPQSHPLPRLLATSRWNPRACRWTSTRALKMATSRHRISTTTTLSTNTMGPSISLANTWEQLLTSMI